MYIDHALFKKSKGDFKNYYFDYHHLKKTLMCHLSNINCIEITGLLEDFMIQI